MLILCIGLTFLLRLRVPSYRIVHFQVFQLLMVLMVLCWTDLFDYHSTVDEKTNEDVTQSFSDKSRGLLQTSHSTEQSVFSSECVRVDTSNQLDTADDCKQSGTPCDDQMHVDSGKQSCEVCTKKSTRSDSFKRHMLNHTGERPFSCKVCNKKFKWPTNLKDHMLIHTGERPFSCKVCSKKFTLSSSLKEHMPIHSGERPFSCKVCNKTFTRSSHLKRHVLIHSGERHFSCKVCNKKFTLSSSLKRHIVIHTGERCWTSFLLQGLLPDVYAVILLKNLHAYSHRWTSCSCKVCNKKFTMSSHFKLHMLIQRSFCCKVCAKKFMQSSSLKTRMLTHTRERPFSCKVCSKKFTHLFSLKSHILIHKG